jgi:hypothetical protein
MRNIAMFMTLAVSVAAFAGCGKRTAAAPQTERFEIRIGSRVIASGETLHRDAVAHRRNMTRYRLTESEESGTAGSVSLGTGSHRVGMGGSYTPPAFSGGGNFAPVISLSYAAPAVGTGGSTGPGYTYAATPGAYLGGSCNLSASVDRYFSALAALSGEASAALSVEAANWKAMILSEAGPYACYVARALDCISPLVPRLIYAEAHDGDVYAIQNQMQACVYQMPKEVAEELARGVGSGIGNDDGESSGGDSVSGGSVVGSCRSSDDGHPVCVEYSGQYAKSEYKYHQSSGEAQCTDNKHCTASGANGKCRTRSSSMYVTNFYYGLDSDALAGAKIACGYSGGTWTDL